MALLTSISWSMRVCAVFMVHPASSETLLRLHQKLRSDFYNSYTCFRLLSQASKTKWAPVVIALVPSKTACPFGLKRFWLLRLFLCLSTWWWKPLWARAEALLTLTDWMTRHHLLARDTTLISRAAHTDGAVDVEYFYLISPVKHAFALLCKLM